MSTEPVAPRLDTFECAPEPAGLSDSELVRRFAANNDGDAFAALVRRYGPLVLGLCRRVLHHAQDTEDAFQATFLVLARKAGTIHKQASLWSWLYKVAYRIALRARATQARRRAQEHQAVQHLKLLPTTTAADPGLGELLDEEVQRLPEKYRAPVLLCYLQGATNEEAAIRLRCPTGTVKIRLLRARQLLRKRLERRAVALSLSALAAALVQEAAAAVPPALLARTVHGVTLVGGGYSPMGAGLTAQVARLAEGSLKRMCLTKLKVALAVLVTVLLCAGTDVVTQCADAAQVLPTKNKEVRPAPQFDTDSPPSTPLPHFLALEHRGQMASGL
jgi:RNA polymerase sigma factor (sigma-70 family)